MYFLVALKNNYAYDYDVNSILCKNNYTETMVNYGNYGKIHGASPSKSGNYGM